MNHNYLLQYVDDIAKAMDEKLQVDEAILDFSKAFDKVPYSRLLYKLKYMGSGETYTIG